MKTRRTSLTLLALFFLLSVFARDVTCQTTIVNVAATDVVAAKKVYVEMDFITNYAWQHDDAKFANYLPRAVVGVGHGVEVGANLSYTRVPRGGAPIELQPNAKWQFYNDEGKGLAAAAGCIWFVPVTHRPGSDTLGQCYSVASKQFSGSHGARFTGGGYVLIGADPAQPNKAGAIVGYQQPLAKKVGFVIDWSSGENRLGYVSPGLYVNTWRNGSLSAGYSIANHGRGRNALFVYYGKQF